LIFLLGKGNIIINTFIGRLSKTWQNTMQHFVKRINQSTNPITSMKKINLIIILLLLSISACKQPEFIQHVVFFNLQDDTSPETLEEIKEFTELLTEIEVVKDFQFGLNSSPEGLDKGFNYCLIMKFDSEFDRDSVYLPHPKHLQFVERIGEHITDVIVFDLDSAQ